MSASAQKKLEKLGVPKCSNVGVKGGLPALKGKEGKTDYPLKGENKKIDFKNSKYALFPLDLAIELANAYPKAWCKGGNHFGNYAFAHYFDVMEAIENNKPIPKDALRWIKKREMYIARHRRDYRLAGIIAMIKWAGFVDGYKGRGNGAEDSSSIFYMIDTIEKYGS